jgi:hypothetical protein
MVLVVAGSYENIIYRALIRDLKRFIFPQRGRLSELKSERAVKGG